MIEEKTTELRRVRAVIPMGGEKTPRKHFHAIKLYLTPDDNNDIIVKNLGESQRQEYSDSTWVPVELKLNTADMTIEGIFVPSR